MRQVLRPNILTVGAALGLFLAASAGAGEPRPAPEPIDDLQRLFIEDTVALIHPPSPETGARAKALMDRAGQARARSDFAAMRRDLAEARVLLGGGEWTPAARFAASLAVRPAHVAIDPARPLAIRIAQFFPAPPPAPATTLRAGLRRKGEREVAWCSPAKSLSAMPKAGVTLLCDASTASDGSYDLVIAANDAQAPLPVWLAAGLDRDLAAIARRSRGLKTSPAMQASLAWPGDLVRTLDDRTRQVTEVALRPLLDRTLALLAEAESGRDPLTGARGELERHYLSPVSHRIEPYRIFVPPSGGQPTPLPLVVLLHGSNGNQDRMLAGGKAVALALQCRCILLSPMGYSPNSGWGNHLPVVLANGTMPAPRPSTIAGKVLPRDGVDPEPAERDVLDTIALVRNEYPVDPRRIYLAGNSMGGEGTWHLAQRHPKLWAAVAPGAGAIAPERYPYARLGQLPVLGVHGEADEIISFSATKEMVERLNQAGGKAELLAVHGEGHGAFNTVLDRVFAFLLAHTRTQPGQP